MEYHELRTVEVTIDQDEFQPLLREPENETIESISFSPATAETSPNNLVGITVKTSTVSCTNTIGEVHYYTFGVEELALKRYGLYGLLTPPFHASYAKVNQRSVGEPPTLKYFVNIVFRGDSKTGTKKLNMKEVE